MQKAYVSTGQHSVSSSSVVKPLVCLEICEVSRLCPAILHSLQVYRFLRTFASQACAAPAVCSRTISCDSGGTKLYVLSVSALWDASVAHLCCVADKGCT